MLMVGRLAPVWQSETCIRSCARVESNVRFAIFLICRRNKKHPVLKHYEEQRRS